MIFIINEIVILLRDGLLVGIASLEIFFLLIILFGFYL